MRAQITAVIVLAITASGLVACGSEGTAPDGTDEHLETFHEALLSYGPNARWPVSNGVATIPYEMAAYDGSPGRGLSDSARAEFLAAMQYVSAATSNHFRFVENPSAIERLRFEGRPSWDSHVAFCKAGRVTGGPTSCSLRLSEIVAIAHRKDGSAEPLRVYFADGTYRRCTLDNLSPDADVNLPVTYPINPTGNGKRYTPSDVAAIDHSGPGVIVWYKNGYTSKGSETDLGSTVAPRPFTSFSFWESVAGVSRRVTLRLAGVAISPGGVAHAFWLDPRNRAPGEFGLFHTTAASSTDLVGNSAHHHDVILPEDRSPLDIAGMVYDETAALQTFFQSKARATGSPTELGARGVVRITMHGMPKFILALHELSHGLGFAHEQQRPDRDSYVVIDDDSGDYGRLPFAEPFGGYDFAALLHYERIKRRGDNVRVPNNENAYSWRDLRGMLMAYGFGDPQAHWLAEIAAVANWAQAAKTQGRRLVYSPATGRLPSDIVGLDVEDDTGTIRTYYKVTTASGTHLRTSHGTAYDLGRHLIPAGGVSVEHINVSDMPSAAGVEAAAADISAVAFSDGEAITWFKSNAAGCASKLWRTRGSYFELESVRSAQCVTLPSGYTADDIRDIARHRYDGVTRFVTLYRDATFSVGSTTNLAATSGATFSLSFSKDEAFDAARVHGFAIHSGAALFFMGCVENETSCGSTAYRFFEVPDFVSARLPAQYR